MSVSNDNMSEHSHDPEQIDLIDLLVQLWRGEVAVVIAVVITIMLAVGYLAVTKEEWTSTAIVTRPDVSQIAIYNSALNVLYGASTSKATDLQENVIGRFSTSLSALTEMLDNQEKPRKLTIGQSVKGQPLPLAISCVSGSPKDAQRQLAECIQQTGEKAARGLEFNLVDDIKLQATTLQNSLKTQEVVAQEQKDLRVRQIQEALRYAEQTGVIKPQIQQTQDVTQGSMFLLSSDALKSMIEHESAHPLILSDNYFQTKQKLLDIESLKFEGTELHAYRYVMKPTLPIRRDSPRKAIIFMLAVLLGEVVDADVVLGRNTLRSYKTEAE